MRINRHQCADRCLHNYDGKTGTKDLQRRV